MHQFKNVVRNVKVLSDAVWYLSSAVIRNISSGKDNSKLKIKNQKLKRI